MNEFSMRTRTLMFAVLFSTLSATTVHAQLKLDRFFPPVVSIGTESTIRAEGTLTSWPPELHCDRDGITLRAVQDSKDVVIDVPSDAAPGITWIRMSDPTSVTACVPVLITPGTVTMETEPNDNRTDATTLALPAVLAGRLAKNGDSDGYRVSLSAGDRLVVSLTANQILKSPMDAVLQLTDLNGNVLAQVDDVCGLDPQLSYLADTDDDFLIRVFAFPETPDSTVNYAGSDSFVYVVTASIDGTAEPVWDGAGTIDDPSRATLVSFGESHDGSLPVIFSGHLTESDQTHAYSIQVVKGTKYHAAIRSRFDGFLLDSHLSIIDQPSGSVLASNDDGARNDFDSQVEFTAKENGRVNVVVSDTVGGFGPRHFYRLTIREARPEYQLTVAEDRFVAADGKPVEISVNITRRFGFDRKLQIVARGLPEPITVEPVISETSGNSTKNVKLKLNTVNTPAGHYRFQIVGTALDSDNQPTNEIDVATYALRPNKNLNEFWLTLPSNQTAKPVAKSDSP